MKLHQLLRMCLRAWILCVATLALLSASAWTKAEAQPPQINAKAAIVVEPTSGEVVFRDRPDLPLPIASTTKLMTALIVLEKVSLEDKFTVVHYPAAPAESVANLTPGTRMSVADLLRGLLLASGNDAAATLAEGVSGSRKAFVDEMNRKARQLGLENTHFDNPIGLDGKRNYSSAHDLAKLTIALQRWQFFRQTVDSERAILGGTNAVTNSNNLVGRKMVTGVKTGHTMRAGYVLVASGKKKGVEVISVIIGAPSVEIRDADTLKLLRYGLDQYTLQTPIRANQALATASVRFVSGADEPLVAASTIKRAVRKGAPPLTVSVKAPEQLAGPIAARQSVGTAEVRDRGQLVATIDLLTNNELGKVGFFGRLYYYASRPLAIGLIVLMGVALALGIGIVRRRRATTTPKIALR